jgi:F-box and WD-40 domain protein CDC4
MTTHNAIYNMNPPALVRPHVKRRAVSSQNNNAVLSPNFAADGSPSPFPSNPKYQQVGTEVVRPRPRSQTVSVGWIEGDDAVSRHTARLQIELAECVETKTVTTTTTTKRSYPPLLVPQMSLDKLDVKEYPLAHKPTPPELANLSYGIDEQVEGLHENSFGALEEQVRYISTRSLNEPLLRWI